jgi:hypothetical protein
MWRRKKGAREAHRRALTSRFSRRSSGVSAQDVPAIAVGMDGGGAADRYDRPWDDDTSGSGSRGGGYGEYDDAGEEEEEELGEFLEWLGIPDDEPELHWIAEEASRAPFPAGWEEVEQSDGAICYRERLSGAISFEHPNYTTYRGLYERELEAADAAAAQANERTLVVINVPVDAADAELEDALATALGGSLWDAVARFDVFVDLDNVRCAVLRFVSEDARDVVVHEMRALRLPGGGPLHAACEVEAVDDSAELRQIDSLVAASRCVSVKNLPAGIDDRGVAQLFETCDGELFSLRIEDLADEQGANAVIEFTESIAARR